MTMNTLEIRQRYDGAVGWYDRANLVVEFLGLRILRRNLLRQAVSPILEVACGTGANFPFYLPHLTGMAVDLSPRMLAVARARALRIGLLLAFGVTDGAQLAVRDQTFATVLSSLTLCTFPDPLGVLSEMARVCRPGGRILLLEHGRSDRAWLGRWQDRRTAQHAARLGCQWNREPLQLVQEAGLDVRDARRAFFGIFHMIVAAPPSGAGSTFAAQYDSSNER